MSRISWLSSPVLAAAFGLAAVPGQLRAAQGSASSGKAVYDRECARCHGKEGKGNGPLASALSPKPTDFTNQSVMGKRSDEFLTSVIEKGGAANGLSASMPSFEASLTPEQVKSLVAYVRQFAKKGGK